MGAVLGATCAAGTAVAALPLPLWAAMTAGLFVGGWVLQFLGHHFEGKKPEFLDDMRGPLDGPVFLVAEIAFALGMGMSPELSAGPLDIDESAEAVLTDFVKALSWRFALSLGM